MTADHTIDLQAALRKLESWQTKPTPSRQRRFSRFAARGEARLWPGGTDASIGRFSTVHIRDISRGGVGVLSNQPAPLGSFWQVQILTGTLSIDTVPGFCRFCREITPGAFLVGIEFGIEASLLVALGVPVSDIASCEEPESALDMTGDFVDPELVIHDDAA